MTSISTAAGVNKVGLGTSVLILLSDNAACPGSRADADTAVFNQGPRRLKGSIILQLHSAQTSGTGHFRAELGTSAPISCHWVYLTGIAS